MALISKNIQPLSLSEPGKSPNTSLSYIKFLASFLCPQIFNHNIPPVWTSLYLDLIGKRERFDDKL